VRNKTFAASLIKMIKEAILPSVWMGYGDDGIIRIRMQENAYVDLENVKLQYKTIEHLAGNRRIAVLLDARAKFTTTKDAYQYLTQRSQERIGTAVLTSNPFSRAFINTYITVFKPVSPYRLFLDEEKALEWLRELLRLEEDSRLKIQD
jgi:hypothetical protein